MKIRVLEPADAFQFQALRLQALQEAPAAFASSYEEEVGTGVDEVARRLGSTADGAVHGAFNGSTLVGMVGVQREGHRKLAHKAHIWGMYVAPSARRRGIGRRLLQHALEYAGSTLGVAQVKLGVNTENTAAVALYESAGFTVYGLEQGFLLVDGVLHDEYQMVCLVERAR